MPMEMSGWSMAPWLQPGDVLLVDIDVSPKELVPGDVVVVRPHEGENSIVHRVVSSSETLIRTKGDRNGMVDPDWPLTKFVGKVVQRHRNGKWTDVGRGKLLLWLSVRGLLPGQRIPGWMSRTGLRKFIFRKASSPHL